MKLLNVSSRFFFSLLIITALCAAVDAQFFPSSFLDTSSNHQAESAAMTYTYSTTVTAPIPKLAIERGGFNTSRLSKDDLKKWKAIEKIVRQKDQNENFLFPTLHGLWQWGLHSEHTIMIEIIKTNNFQSSTAGSLSIESYDPTCQSHTVTLKLFLSSIDSALSSTAAARKNGFIAFQFLKKEERYAEVLGHELSHAKFILKNNLRTRMVNELIEDTNESILVNAHENAQTKPSPFMLNRISQRDTLLKELELEAEANEEIIWKELVAVKDKKQLR